MSRLAAPPRNSVRAATARNRELCGRGATPLSVHRPCLSFLLHVFLFATAAGVHYAHSRGLPPAAVISATRVLACALARRYMPWLRAHCRRNVRSTCDRSRIPSTERGSPTMRSTFTTGRPRRSGRSTPFDTDLDRVLLGGALCLDLRVYLRKWTFRGRPEFGSFRTERTGLTVAARDNLDAIGTIEFDRGLGCVVEDSPSNGGVCVSLRSQRRETALA